MAKQDIEDFDFDDTEFVIGSDESGVPPRMKTQANSVEVGVEDDDADDIEYEVVDDTPPQDRNRKPLPEDIVEELEQDEAEEYSAKVKQRIDQLKKAWHDERRAKEEAAREREAATQYAQQIMQERDRLRNSLSQGETWALEQAKERAALQLEAAKRAYRDAYESGDADALAEAQQNLSKATYQSEQVASMAPRYTAPAANTLQTSQQPVYNPPQNQPVRAPEPDQRTKDWHQRNTWFGTDDEMTSFALGVHQKLVKENIAPGTDEYFERVDARMKEVFPDKFGASRRKRQPSTVVASAGRSPKGKKVVLTQSQVSMAKRLGVTPEAYAREMVKLEANNG
jgi:hypothetical protein